MKTISGFVVVGKTADNAPRIIHGPSPTDPTGTHSLTLEFQLFQYRAKAKKLSTWLLKHLPIVEVAYLELCLAENQEDLGAWKINPPPGPFMVILQSKDDGEIHLHGMRPNDIIFPSNTMPYGIAGQKGLLFPTFKKALEEGSDRCRQSGEECRLLIAHWNMTYV